MAAAITSTIFTAVPSEDDPEAVSVFAAEGAFVTVVVQVSARETASKGEVRAVCYKDGSPVHMSAPAAMPAKDSIGTAYLIWSERGDGSGHRYQGGAELSNKAVLDEGQITVTLEPGAPPVDGS